MNVWLMIFAEGWIVIGGPDKMKFSRVFKRISEKLIGGIQKILLTVFLVLIYFLGLGSTLIFLILFKRGVIRDGSDAKDSSWSQAEGYAPDLSEGFRQS